MIDVFYAPDQKFFLTIYSNDSISGKSLILFVGVNIYENDSKFIL